ncbi:dynamin-like GTPase mgm1 [Allomyces arbusculus]|nr:dynamin-like GTPase mgm1 [Allomyces arbusculus]
MPLPTPSILRVALHPTMPHQPAARPVPGPLILSGARQVSMWRKLSLLRRLPFFARLPFLAGGTAASAGAYVQYKINHTANWFNDKVDAAKDFLSDKFDALGPLRDGIRDRYEFFSDRFQALVNQERPKFEFPSRSSDGSDPASSAADADSDDADDAAEAERARSRSRNRRSKPAPPPPKLNQGSEADLLDLSRQLRDIRQILDAANVPAHADDLALPRIVVVGPRGAGKSAVADHLLGRGTLVPRTGPTRRPVEVRFEHVPDATVDTAVFPQLEADHAMTDFRDVARTIEKAVAGDTEDGSAVATTPLVVAVRSAKVPDMTIVDLPGWDSETTATLYDQYLNDTSALILAVVPATADTDPTFETVLGRADPMGQRTVRVVTKLDLADPDSRVRLLTATTRSRVIGLVLPGHDESAMIDLHAKRLPVGLSELRTTVRQTAERRLASRLDAVVDQVHHEVATTNYQYKVAYNDRRISAESYLAQAVDALKTRFAVMAREFGKAEVRQAIRAELEKRLVALCDQHLWQDPLLAALPNAREDDRYWMDVRDRAAAGLTKCGIGRITTELTVNALMARIDEVLRADDTLEHHAATRDRAHDLAEAAIARRFHLTIDQVENTIKPYKDEVECTDAEWTAAVRRAMDVLDREVQHSSSKYYQLRSEVGWWTLSGTMAYLTQLDAKAAGDPVAAVKGTAKPFLVARAPARNPAHDPLLAMAVENKYGGYDAQAVHAARDALYHWHRSLALAQRRAAVSGRACRQPTSQAMTICPEVYLAAVAEKLADTAAMFIALELLHDVYHQWPRAVDAELFYGQSRAQAAAFAAENPVVQRHLLDAAKKAALEETLAKLRAARRQRTTLEEVVAGAGAESVPPPSG